MASENSKLWDILGRTDPSHTKGFTRGGGFKGTAIKPIWSYLRMTEEFGPCGKGWGVNPPTFDVQDCGDERLVFCTASIWYENRDQVCYGVGGDKVIAKFSSGAKTDDEAFKKAYTDAITNALKMIGVGADVHMGKFDDNKYVNAMREEFAEEQQPDIKRQTGYRDDGSRTSYALKKEDPDAFAELQRELEECKTLVSLESLKAAWREKARAAKWNKQYMDSLKDRFDGRQAAIVKELEALEPDELAEVPLPDALRASLAQHPLNGG